MKRSLSIFASVWFATSCWFSSMSAQTQLTLHPANGESPWAISLDEMKKTTFTENGLTFFKSDNSTENVPFDQLQKITFNDVSTAIVSSEADNQSLHLIVKENFLTLKGWKAIPFTRIQISATNGTLLLSINNWNGDPINIQSLQPGIYLFTINNHTLKFCQL